MKKLSLLSAIMGFAVIGGANAADITVYHSPSCPHCHHAREFIEGSLVYEYPELKVSEVNVMEESALPVFQDALKKCEYESGGVPVIVIGEKCFQGYAEFMQQELRDAIEVDMSDDAKKIAADNKSAMEKDADAFKAANADRANAVSNFADTATAEVQDVQKKNESGSSIYFYALLVALVAALGFVLIRKDKKK